MKYREERCDAGQYKETYVKSLEELLERRQKEAAKVRFEYRRDLLKDQERYRREFKEMLGWPLADYEEAGLPGVTSEKLSEEDGYTIYRMQFEILGGVKLTGLYFRADGDQERPLVLLQHGGQGTPELISGMFGSTSNYNDMLHRVRKYGVHVFAPQLLLWADEYQVPFDRRALDARLKRVGSSITAVELYGLIRILDYFEAQAEVSVFGMVGLSYGGFYTLFAAAADPRIRSAVSCSFFNTRDQVGWSDWVWQRSAERFDDAEIACLVYPRRLCLEIGSADALFDAEYGREAFRQIQEICGEAGTDWTELIVFDGVHEFCMEDAPLERLVEDLKREQKEKRG